MKRQQNFIRTVAIFYFLFAWLPATEATDAISLQGRWAFRLDPKGQGLEEQWQNTALPDKIDLPGALQSQGYGEDISVDTQWTCNILTFPWHKLPEYEKYRQPGNIKVPFWLQPDKHYVGAAWYQREIEIPQAWKAKSVLLSLERPHWETRAWVDGKEIGRNESLSTPHDYNLGILNPGKHRVTIRVDNRMIVEVGRDAHSVTDHTQGNWNGIVGKIELRPRDPIWIESQAIFPKNDGTVLVKLRIRSDLFDPVAGEITTSIIERKSGKLAGKGCCDIELPRGTRVDGSRILSANVEKEITVKLDRPPELWNEFNPELYVAESKLEVKTDSHYTAAATATFGFRELAAQGTQFTLNGQKIFFRGTLECCIFPLTGHPPTDVDSWKRIIRIAKAHGLNLLRFHSWCPPEAAFIAADELGFYYQVECAAWATVGDGKPIDKWLYEEADRILEAYGNHPSFLLMPYGNEPSGDKHVQYLAAWVKHFKEQDKRRLYTSASGWPQIEESLGRLRQLIDFLNALNITIFLNLCK
jgi:beta-galactosidase/beta-glucuronidase